MTDHRPPAANRMGPDRAPTPFSAAEIADGCRPGRVSVYRITEQGAPPVVLHWEFTGGDDEAAEYVAQTLDERHRELGPPVETRAAWTELQGHASYPDGATTIDIETIDVPAGTFTCWRYTVDDGPLTTVVWFPFDLPGPPARKVDHVGGEEVATMTLLEFSDPRRS